MANEYFSNLRYDDKSLCHLFGVCMELSKAEKMSFEVRCSAIELTLVTLIATLKTQGMVDSKFEEIIINQLQAASDGLGQIMLENGFTNDETVDVLRESRIILDKLYLIQSEL